MRAQASLLISKTHVVKPYGLFESLKIVPSRNSVKEASKDLILLSNSVFGPPEVDVEEIFKARKEIERLLNIKTRDS